MFDPVTEIKIKNNNKLPKMGSQQTLRLGNILATGLGTNAWHISGVVLRGYTSAFISVG